LFESIEPIYDRIAAENVISKASVDLDNTSNYQREHQAYLWLNGIWKTEISKASVDLFESIEPIYERIAAEIVISKA
jgi:hypothetical protein